MGTWGDAKPSLQLRSMPTTKFQSWQNATKRAAAVPSSPPKGPGMGTVAPSIVYLLVITSLYYWTTLYYWEDSLEIELNACVTFVWCQIRLHTYIYLVDKVHLCLRYYDGATGLPGRCPVLEVLGEWFLHISCLTVLCLDTDWSLAIISLGLKKFLISRDSRAGMEEVEDTGSLAMDRTKLCDLTPITLWLWSICYSPRTS